jgi:biopolymer transport protein ExbD
MDAGPSPQPTTRAPLLGGDEESLEDNQLVPSKPIVDDARFDVTAMVDLVFMMNIYFLVSWTQTAMAEIDLPAAQHCTAADGERSQMITILKGPRVYLGSVGEGKELSANEIDARVQDVVERGMLESPKKDIVLIKAERDVPIRDVWRVAGVATSVTGTQLMLGVMEVK